MARRHNCRRRVTAGGRPGQALQGEARIGLGYTGARRNYHPGRHRRGRDAPLPAVGTAAVRPQADPRHVVCRPRSATADQLLPRPATTGLPRNRGRRLLDAVACQHGGHGRGPRPRHGKCGRTSPVRMESQSLPAAGGCQCGGLRGSREGLRRQGAGHAAGAGGVACVSADRSGRHALPQTGANVLGEHRVGGERRHRAHARIRAPEHRPGGMDRPPADVGRSAGSTRWRRYGRQS